MPYGYTGKILHADLTKSELSIEEPEEKFYRTISLLNDLLTCNCLYIYSFLCYRTYMHKNTNLNCCCCLQTERFV